MLNIEAIEAFSLPQLRYHLQQYNLPTSGGPKGGVKKFLQEKLKAHILSMNVPTQPSEIGDQEPNNTHPDQMDNTTGDNLEDMILSDTNTATLSNERDYNGTVGDTVEGTVGDLTAHSLPNFGAIAKLKVTRRIPKAARFAAAKELTRRITEVVSDQNERSWGNLFAFASSCFNVPAKVKRNGPSLATIIKRNIVKFEREGYTSSTTVPNLSNASKRDKKKDDELLSKMVSAKISSGDIKGAVRILASD